MFSPDDMMDFQLFSMEHIMTLLLFTIMIVLFITTFSTSIYIKKIGIILVWTLLISELTFQTWSIMNGLWTVQSTLPLQLCSISTFLGIYLFYKRSEKIFFLFLYIGFIPPILALITPDIPYSFPHFRYIKYFIHHTAIPFMVLYLFFSDNYKIPKKSIVYGMVLLNILAIPIYLLNWWIGSNYFFLGGPPEGNTPLLWFGEGIYYIVNLELAGMLVFFITFLFFTYLERRRSRLTDRTSDTTHAL
ncbi:YwaF family protein [Rossellomorea aquimaris]|uniref:YwaF family protein n=1 Tax=Rossellomorea aquimaris TaxID=189382 RepID=UPI0007D09F0A|nr:TIGR02206 family membrane protein [Rossellomorea aquimaris]